MTDIDKIKEAIAALPDGGNVNIFHPDFFEISENGMDYIGNTEVAKALAADHSRLEKELIEARDVLSHYADEANSSPDGHRWLLSYSLRTYATAYLDKHKEQKR